jgi:hypothetical protein
MIRESKIETVSQAVSEVKGDTGKLYEIFNNLVGRKTENPVPER